MDPRALRQRIEASAKELGFDAFGVAPVEVDVRADYFRKWIADGMHGDMAWLARNPDRRTDARQVLPEARWVPLEATHPIFHSFFEINSLDIEGFYGQAEWTGIFEDNDPGKRLLAVANYNHDLGELWEFSETGYLPVDLTNEAYKFGVNYVMYAMTH